MNLYNYNVYCLPLYFRDVFGVELAKSVYFMNLYNYNVYYLPLYFRDVFGVELAAFEQQAVSVGANEH